MANEGRNRIVEKRCFVTIGATAPFNGLLEAVFDPTFLKALHDANYTELRIQYGDEGRKIFEENMQALEASLKPSYDINVTGFGFNKQGLRDEITAVKGSGSVSSSKSGEGVVVSHGGSGSILEVMRLGVPLVVVPNTDLLHNHQLELAEELADQQYVIHGKIDELSSAIADVEDLKHKMRKWPPMQSGEDKQKKSLASVMSEEMGWLD